VGASTLTSSLLLRLDGDISLLRRALAAGATEVDAFARKAAGADQRGAAVGQATTTQLDKRVSLLTKGAQIEATREASLRKLVGVEQGLSTALKSGNLTLQQRVDLEGLLARTRAAMPGAPALVPPGAAGQLTAVGDAAKRTAFSVSSLVPAFNGLAARAIGVDSTIGTLVGTIGSIGSAEVTGIVLAGIAVIGGAYALLSSRAKQAAKDAREAEDEFRRLARGGNLQAVTQQRTDIFSGNPNSTAEDPATRLREERGIQGTRRELEAAKRERALVQAQQDALRTARASTNQAKALQAQVDASAAEASAAELDAAIAKLKAQLTTLEGQHAKLTRLEQTLATRAAGTTDFEIREQAQQKHADTVKEAAERTAREIADFVRDAADTVARASADMADDVALKLDRLTARAKALGQEQAASYLQAKAALEQQLADAEAAKRAAAEAADIAARAGQTRELDTVFNDARLGRIGAKDAVEALHFGLTGVAEDPKLGARLTEWAEQLQAIADNEALGNEQRARAKTLLDEVNTAFDRAFGGGGKGTGAEKPNPKPAHDWATEIARGTRALIDAASAAGLLDANLASALQTAANLADNVAKVIATGGKDAGSVVGAISAAVALGTQLFGKSPEQRAQEGTNDANRRATEALTRAIGDLAGLLVSGRAFSATGNAVRGAVAGFGTASDNAKFKNASDFFAAAGVSMDDLEAIAKSLHITLDGTVGSFRRLDEAIRKADFAAFAGSWEGALSTLDLLFDVDNVESPLAKLLAFAGAARQRSPLFDSLLGAFDLGDAAGRSTVRDAARRWLDTLLSGAFSDTSFLGDLSQGQAIEALRRLINELDGIGDAAVDTGSAADAAATALDRLNASLSDIALIGDVVGKSVEGVFQAIDAAAAAFPKFGDGIRQLVAGLDLSTAEGQSAFKQRVRDFGGQLAQGGLTDDERDVLRWLNSLGGILPDLASAADGATTSVGGATASIDQLSEAADALSRKASQAATDAKRMGQDPNAAESAVFSGEIPGLGAIDVHNPEQVKAGLDFLRKIYGQLKDTDTALKDLFGQAIDFFEQFDPGAAAGASSFGRPSFLPTGLVTDEVATSVHSLTRETGADIADVMRSSFRVELDQLDELRRIAAALTTQRTPLPVPQIPGFGAGLLDGGGAGGGLTALALSVTIPGATFVVGGTGTTAGDGAALGDEVLRALRAALRDGALDEDLARALGSLYRRRGLARGGLTA
jgi:hypothetical protein